MLDPTAGVPEKKRLKVARWYFYVGLLCNPWLLIQPIVMFWPQIRAGKAHSEVRLLSLLGVPIAIIWTIVIVAWAIHWQNNWKTSASLQGWLMLPPDGVDFEIKDE
eukprot:TRINITY_DN6695_c1_g1_i1.p1 TRINITY_DN6695_c1_g1~~TRINITY_DN6695_c1_g1_i1.p1  ORF type:complete len:106 (-),score=14.06 TRINITY_DN6695_c1_g1_i1:51-368(-)